VLAALVRIGWRIKRESGSHKTLARDAWPDVVFAFHDGEEIGPRMLARHSVAPRRLLDVQSLALAAGAALPTFTYANYGRLGHDVARTLKSRRREGVWTRVLGVDSRNPATGLVQWELFPQVAAAV